MEITGPRSRVARIAAVIADPIDLANTTGTATFRVNVFTEDSFVRFLDHSGSGGHRDHEEEVKRGMPRVSDQGEVLGKQLFGTDGIRGVAGEYPLDPLTVYAFGVALGKDAAAHAAHPEILIGTDTRESGPWIAEMVAGGLASQGATRALRRRDHDARAWPTSRAPDRSSPAW